VRLRLLDGVHRVEVVTSAFRLLVAGFDGLDSISQRLSQEALAADPDHDPERPSLEVLALADHDDVDSGDPVRLPRKGVGVPPRRLPTRWSRWSS
jgi:hypothetical protein